jgi:hypothetical protein
LLGIAFTLGIAPLLGALALGGTAPLPLGVTVTLYVASLFRPLLANSALPFALDGPLTFTGRLLRFGLAIPFNSAWGTVRATCGTVDTRLLRLCRAWRIHLALRGSAASAGGPTHATGLAATRRSATSILSAASALRVNVTCAGHKRAARDDRDENSSHDRTPLEKSSWGQRRARGDVPAMQCAAQKSR